MTTTKANPSSDYATFSAHTETGGYSQYWELEALLRVIKETLAALASLLAAPVFSSHAAHAARLTGRESVR